MRLLTTALLLSLAVPFAARAEPPIVRAEAQTRSVDCAGDAAQLEGNRNTITFTNACRSLLLRGEANTVQIELAPGARIDVEGNGNHIRYSLPGGSAPPAVRVSGSNTDLSPDGATGGGTAAPQTVTLTGDDQKLEVDCGGRAVSIQGNRSRYTLHGGCRSVSVHGDGNTVIAELRADSSVEIEGNGTALSYSVLGAAGQPQVSVRGNNSRASRIGQTGEVARPATPAVAVVAAPPPDVSAQPPASPATATASAPSVPQLMHDLDAQVVAQGTLVALPSDALFGPAPDQLRADATPRLTMLAQLAAQIHPSGVRVSARAPDAGLAGRQSQAVQAWLVSPGQVRPSIKTEASAGAAQMEVLLLR